MSQPQHAKPVQFRLMLLGSPVLLDSSGQGLAGLGPGKPLAMLAYLVLAGRTSREDLVALLWGDMPEERARNAFRQTLHRLRGGLGADMVLTVRDSVAVASDGSLWCDALEFMATAGSDRIDRALELYQGPFLGRLDVGSGPFEQWAEDQRNRLAAQHRDALARAAQTATENGELDKALKYAHQLATAAPLDAEVALLEASALLSAGRKPEAISALTVFSGRLRAELGEPPPASISGMLESLLHEGGSRSPASSARGASQDFYGAMQPPFVGREPELGRLLAAWRRLGQTGTTFVVTGPQGIGKTRLLSELGQRLASTGPALMLWGQERPTGQAIPYAAIAEALRPTVNAPGVAGASQHLLSEAARLLPELRDQFKLPDAGPLEDDAARLRFYDGIAALLDAVSYEQPVCVVVEDLHLASTSSITLLNYLAVRLASSPVMFALTYREKEATTFLLESFPPGDGRGGGRGGPETDGPSRGMTLRQVTLGPLDGDALTEIVSSLTGPEELDPVDARRIVELSEGVPLRVIELIRRLRHNQPLATAPREVSEILWGRLQSCSPQEQRLFLTTALYWRAASLRTLAAAAHLSEPDTLDAAMVLERRGLVAQRGGGIAPAHDVIASRALESAGSAGLALLAGWAADALASDAGGTNAELAHLYSLAGQKTAAHRHCRSAIHDAAASAAYDDVEALLQLGLQTVSSESDRLAIESLRRAFGGGLKRLASGERAAPVAQPTTTPAQPSPDLLEEKASAMQPQSRTPRFRRRYALTVGAFAVVALVALATFRRNSVGARGIDGELRDTLVVVEKVDARNTQRFFLSGSVVPPPSLTRARTPDALLWTDSIVLPWLNARVAPDGRLVAVERMTPGGTDLYVIRSDRSDTIGIAVGPGDDIAAGWSPDGRWLLATSGMVRDGAYDTDLTAYSVAAPPLAINLDAAPGRSVVEAAWSPRGTMIGWVAREGSTRQQDIFVSEAGGLGVRNVTSHPAEDYHFAWAPDGEALLFTSDRSGNAELYSIGVRSRQLRRLTIDDAHDDRAAYSPDGNFVAFESTRAGSVGIYVMKPAGGNPRRVTPPDRNFELAGWQGRPPYIERLRLTAPDALSPGDSGVVMAHLSDQFGSPLPPAAISWGSSGPASVTNLSSSDSVTASRYAMIRTSRNGLARIVATAGGWREDTAYIRVGDVLSMLSEGFESGIESTRWISLGTPAPTIAPGSGRNGSAGLALNADNQWESGLLSRAVFPLRAGLSVSGRVSAPFGGRAIPATVGLWLVAAESEADLDPSAPQFLKIAGIAWLGEAGRVAYSAEREFSTEPAGVLDLSRTHSFQVSVDRDNRVSFYVDGRLRRRSTVLVTRPGEAARVQLWVGGRGTGGSVVVDDLQVLVGDAP